MYAWQTLLQSNILFYNTNGEKKGKKKFQKMTTKNVHA